jgi:rSAM/selenodomain-associated transferase 2
LDARLRLSVVVPVLNEAGGIRAALEALAPLRASGHEVIVVDGGSTDGTRELTAGLCDRVLGAPRGRALQMNAGARVASGDMLLFLHADTRLPAGFVIPDASVWGRFDVRIDGRHPLLKVVAWAMNLRSRLTGIATGDQAMFVRREAFPGFAEIPLMEDIALSKALKRRAAPLCLREKVLTSGRRWESRGVLRTIVLMWHLRFLYFLGVSPDALVKKYQR